MLSRRISVAATRITHFLLPCLLLLVGVGFSINLAHGHAALVASNPTEQATLSNPPTQATLTFNEPVSALRMQLFAPKGRAYPLESRAEDSLIQLALPTLTEQGSYVLSWRVMSTDGHPVGGSLLFAYGQSSTPSDAINTQGSASKNRTTAIWLTRLLIYCTLFFGLASQVFNAWQFPAASRSTGIKARLALSSSRYLALLYIGMAATLVYLALFGLDALDLPLSGVLEPHLWHTALYSSVGVASLMLLSAFALGSYQAKSKRLALCLAALALAAASLAVTGHASMAPPQWLSRPAVWLHTVAVMAWMGALLPLLYGLQAPAGAPYGVGDIHNPHANNGPLVIFSRYIPLAILALLLSGAVLAYLPLTAWSSFINSRYGQILLAKLMLVALLLLLGAYNRYRLTAAVLRQEATARLRLKRVIYAELVLMVLVLALVALWRFTPPSRNTVNAQASAAAPTAIYRFKKHQVQAELKLESQQLQIALYQPDHRPLRAQAVEVRFSDPSTNMEPLHFQAHRVRGQEQAENQWLLATLPLTPGSHWHVDIVVLVSDFERVTLQGELTLLELDVHPHSHSHQHTH
ncbi:copper resistance CopC/CopD family protein [Oceanisphaera avium]|uniref:Copper resistance protein C n=1 Tax=Oceanisphaera avium TaxID=1903694 RepID=A0A1Y0CWE0_9GAMM|nr:copper resistance protein CopC [Oceanisphaera avium]ART79663.1 hypothetical protein CBP12_05425 [Oceanisphaera avium]